MDISNSSDPYLLDSSINAQLISEVLALLDSIASGVQSQAGALNFGDYVTASQDSNQENEAAMDHYVAFDVSQVELPEVSTSEPVAEAPGFECDNAGCVVSCKRRGDLARHKTTAHGVVRFFCDVCGKKYRRKDNLRRHKKQKHTASLGAK